MVLNKNAMPLREYFWAAIMATLAFYALIGPNALNPLNIAWLSQGDPAQHFLGWHFFRTSPWMFPLGLNPAFGLELSNSIVYSDSNPLLALLGKLFSDFLPDIFQYFGLWLLGCLFFQAYFSLKLVGLISDRFSICILGASLLVMSPPMLWRLSGHFNLFGHFLIIAGLFLVFSPDVKRRKLVWGCLLVVSALVHAYLLAMVTGLWAADIARRKCEGTGSFKTLVLEALLVLSTVAIACWMAGYFSVQSGLGDQGFGFYRMNLFSLFDSSGWSYILKDLPEGQGDYEGFNYLGIGVLFLALCALPSAVIKRKELLKHVWKFRFVLFVLLSMAAFSLSCRVGIGEENVLFPYTDKILQYCSMFRASGRIFWPVFYSIIFVILFLVIRLYSYSVTISLLLFAVVIQCVDTSAGWLVNRKRLMVEQSSIWETPLKDTFWKNEFPKYKKIKYILPHNNPSGWKYISYHAAMNTIGTNMVYLARIDESKLKKSQQKTIQTVNFNNYDEDTLYIIDKHLVTDLVKIFDHAKNEILYIDGVYIVRKKSVNSARSN